MDSDIQACTYVGTWSAIALVVANLSQFRVDMVDSSDAMFTTRIKAIDVTKAILRMGEGGEGGLVRTRCHQVVLTGLLATLSPEHVL